MRAAIQSVIKKACSAEDSTAFPRQPAIPITTMAVKKLTRN
jgi:hypothetical protein